MKGGFFASPICEQPWKCPSRINASIGYLLVLEYFKCNSKPVTRCLELSCQYVVSNSVLRHGCQTIEITTLRRNLYDSPAGNYMFKVNNRNTRTWCETCSKLTIKLLAIGVVLLTLLLTLNIFHILF